MRTVLSALWLATFFMGALNVCAIIALLVFAGSRA